MFLGYLIGEKIDDSPHHHHPQQPFCGNEFQSDNYGNHSPDSKELRIHYSSFLWLWCITARQKERGASNLG